MREAKVTNVGKSSFLWTQCSLSAVRQTLCISLKLRFITSCVLRSACVQHWNLIWEQSEVCAAGSRLKHTHRFGLTFYTKMLSSRSAYCRTSWIKSPMSPGWGAAERSGYWWSWWRGLSSRRLIPTLMHSGSRASGCCSWLRS